MQINKETLNQFRKDFAEAVKGLEEKYEGKIHLGNISYEHDSFTGEVSFKNEGLDSKLWNINCEDFGLRPDDLGRRFYYKSHEYTIIGWRNNSKFSVMTTREDGKGIDFTPSLARGCLGR